MIHTIFTDFVEEARRMKWGYVIVIDQRDRPSETVKRWVERIRKSDNLPLLFKCNDDYSVIAHSAWPKLTGRSRGCSFKRKDQSDV